MIFLWLKMCGDASRCTRNYRLISAHSRTHTHASFYWHPHYELHVKHNSQIIPVDDNSKSNVIAHLKDYISFEFDQDLEPQFIALTENGRTKHNKKSDAERDSSRKTKAKTFAFLLVATMHAFIFMEYKKCWNLSTWAHRKEIIF